MPHIVIIGAGITGVTTAYTLRRRGYDVTVLDRNRYAAMETSFANGGQLSASNAEVWNSVSTVMKGLKWMTRKDAPLLLNPTPSWHKLSWMAEFIGRIPDYAKNTVATARLAIEARQHLFAIAECENISFDLERRGILHIYHDKEGFEAAMRVNDLLRQGGLDRHPVTPGEMCSIEPALSRRYHGGFFTPSDATGDIHKFTRGLADACARHGVAFVYDAFVDGILPEADRVEIRWSSCKSDTREDSSRECSYLRADAVVICAGSDSRRFARMLGDRINVYPVKGYSITLALGTEADAAAPRVSLLDDGAKIVTSRLGRDRLRVAGTAEFNGFNRDIRADRIRPLVEWVRHHFPALETDRVVPWSGLRPMMPDMMPRVNAGRRPRVFYNTGHGHLGWTLSSATAELVAEKILSRLPL